MVYSSRLHGEERYARGTPAETLQQATHAVKQAEKGFGETIAQIQKFLASAYDGARLPKVSREVSASWLHLNARQLNTKLAEIRNELQDSGVFHEGNRLSDDPSNADCMYNQWNRLSEALWSQHKAYHEAIEKRGAHLQRS